MPVLGRTIIKKDVQRIKQRLEKTEA